MKKTSRLFVLLLALCVMMTSMPLLSLAEETVAETTMDQATESVEEEVLAEEPVLEIEPEVITEVIQQTEPEVTTEAVPEDEQGFMESVDAEETTSTEATAETQEVEAPATEDDTAEEETPAEPIAEEGEVETEEEGEEESPADEEEAPVDEESAEGEETAEEAEFEEDEPTDTRSIEGYATVLAGTTVYTDAMRQEKLGEFKTSETVYAVTIQQMDRVENDLIWIGFDTEARRNAGESTLGGFVYGKDIRKISDEQQAQIAAQLEKDEDAREVSVYGKGVKRLVSCVAFAMEEKATESTEGDDEGEQTEAVETTPEEPEDESADEPEDEKVEILDTHTASGIVSLVPSNTTVTMKNDMSFTIQTETGYNYVAMYSEQGAFVADWNATSYSRISNGVRIWTIPYSFQSWGNRYITFKAGPNANALYSDWTVNINVLPIPSVTGISAPGSVLAQNNMTLTVTTSKNAYYLRMYSETGAVAKTWSTSDSTYRDSGDNRIWTVQYAIQTPGARTLTLKASVNNREYGTGKSFNVNVAGVTSVTASTTSASVGTPITFTVKTSTGVKYIALCAENGNVVRTWNASSSGTTTVSYAFTAGGNRTIYFKGSTDGQNYGGAKAIGLSIGTAQMLKSVTPEFTAVTAQNNLKITAETTTDAAYIAMFAEDGYRVCYWSASQSSVVSNGTRKWTLSYAFQTAGIRKLTFRAGTTLNTLGDPKTINLTVMEIPKIVSLSAPSSAVAQNEMTISVTTPKNAYYLALYAENNSYVRTWSTSSGVHKDSGNNRIWTIKYTIQTAGTRKLSMRASVNNKQFGSAYAFTVNVTTGKKVTSVNAPSSATVGTPVSITVVTEKGVKSIALFSENGTKAGSWTSGYTTSSSAMTWKVQYTFQGSGSRTLSFRASADGTNFGSAKSFSISVKEPAQTVDLYSKLSKAVGGREIYSYIERDYDGDGKKEAFALLGQRASVSGFTWADVELWFVSNSVVKQCVYYEIGEQIYNFPAIKTYNGYTCYRFTAYNWEGDMTNTRYWTVKNGVPVCVGNTTE